MPGRPADQDGTTDNHRLDRTYVRLALEGVLIFSIGVLCAFMVGIILCRKRLRQRNIHILVCSMAVGGVVFSLLVRPGMLMEEMRNQQMAVSYCGLYLILLDVEMVMVPITIVMMTIEQILHLQDTDKYIGSRAVQLSTAVLPWFLGITVGVARIVLGESVTNRNVYELGTNSSTARSVTGRPTDDPEWYRCAIVGSPAIINARHIVGILAGYFLPLTFLFITGILMLIIYCSRMRPSELPEAAHDTDEPDSIPTADSGSVVMVLVLNVVMIIILLVNIVLADIYDFYVIMNWPYSAVEMLTMILAMTLLTDIRRSVSRLCSINGDNYEMKPLLAGKNARKGEEPNATNMNK